MSRHQLKKNACLAVSTVAILLLAVPGLLFAGDRMRGPSIHTTESPQANAPVSVPVWFGSSAIHLYSKYISPADGPRSPSYPTSTAYGRDAIASHGFLLGILLIADRLIHESDVHKGPKIIKYGVSRYYDPVAYNTYWWECN